MATELLLPDGIVTAVNLTASFGDLDEGVDNFDGVYATNNGSNSNTLIVFSFPTPTGSLNNGPNLQRFRARVRKNATGGATTTVQLQVWENGSLIIGFGQTTIVSTTGVDVALTWNANLISLQDGSNVEFGVSQFTGGQGGNPNNRRWIEVDAVDWSADYNPGGGGGGAYSYSTFF